MADEGTLPMRFYSMVCRKEFLLPELIGDR